MTTITNNTDQLVKLTIPIYTDLNPHPMRKRRDCRLEVDYKQRLRAAMREELNRCTNELMRQTVIDRYKTKVAAL